MAKLTEQDILNWDGPEEDYMNSDQLAFFRELLVKMQEELIENANTTTGHLQEHESAPDPTFRIPQSKVFCRKLLLPSDAIIIDLIDKFFVIVSC